MSSDHSNFDGACLMYLLTMCILVRINIHIEKKQWPFCKHFVHAVKDLL